MHSIWELRKEFKVTETQNVEFRTEFSTRSIIRTSRADTLIDDGPGVLA